MRASSIEEGIIIMAHEVIAHGAASVHVPEYITINTGKYSPDAEKVQVLRKWGNKEEEVGLFPWAKMHGVKIDYHKFDRYMRTTLHDDSTTTILATGAWHVRAEPPAGR